MQRAFTLVELSLSLLIFGLMILVFGATFPVATRGSKVGASYAQASLLAQHKIDQLRQAGTTQLNGTALRNLQIIDSANAAGDGSFSFANADNLVNNGANQGFYPAGSTGKLFLTTVPTQGGFVPPPRYQAVLVTVTISWTGGNSSSGSLTTHTIIRSK